MARHLTSMRDPDWPQRRNLYRAALAAACVNLRARAFYRRALAAKRGRLA
jgi:hypothetical protein